MRQIDGNGLFLIKAGAQGGSIILTANNSCGTVTSQNDIILDECSNFTYRKYPNPTTDEIVVEQQASVSASATGASSQTANNAASGGISTVQVYDGYGRLRLSQPGQGATAVRLRLNILPDGLYVVHVLRGQAVVHRQRLQVTK